MREITYKAEEVRALRRALRLRQRELAERLGVSRRTIIRGEKRGIEVPYFSTSDTRHTLRERWAELQKLAYEGDTLAIAKKSRPAGGDTLARIHVKVSPRRRKRRRR